MACETKLETIDGRKWSCTQFPASEALEIETILAPVVLQALAPALEALRGSAGQEGGLGKVEISSEVVSKAVSSMFAALPRDEMIGLMKRLCAGDHLFCDGERVDFEAAYAGGKGVALRYKVAAFVLKVNFADFLGEMIPARAKAAAVAAMSRPSPTASA